jgi:hypothetical protein
MCLSGATCLPVFCCFSVRVEQLVYQCSVVSVSEWSNLSTSVLLFQCPSGATCLPVFYCFSVWVEQLVYQCSVVSVSEWSNLSTSVLLFQCLSAATCLPVFCCFSVWVEQLVYQCSVVSVKQQNTGRQVAPLRHWNNRTLVDKLLHSDTETTEHW